MFVPAEGGALPCETLERRNAAASTEMGGRSRDGIEVPHYHPIASALSKSRGSPLLQILSHGRVAT